MAKVWNNKNGLPQNTVFDIKKGGLGFVWAATEEGLVRFDGHELVLFNDTNLPHITSNLFYTITPSKNGGIWAATLHEIVFLSQHVKRVFKTPAFIKDSHISSLAED
ncbi:MAG: hypothetical protein ACO1OQ_10020, partial [Rufibacter sp.]